jgi:hypothetical protein
MSMGYYFILQNKYCVDLMIKRSCANSFDCYRSAPRLPPDKHRQQQQYHKRELTTPLNV